MGASSLSGLRCIQGNASRACRNTATHQHCRETPWWGLSIRLEAEPRSRPLGLAAKPAHDVIRQLPRGCADGQRLWHNAEGGEVGRAGAATREAGEAGRSSRCSAGGIGRLTAAYLGSGSATVAMMMKMGKKRAKVPVLALSARTGVSSADKASGRKGNAPTPGWRRARGGPLPVEKAEKVGGGGKGETKAQKVGPVPLKVVEAAVEAPAGVEPGVLEAVQRREPGGVH